MRAKSGSNSAPLPSAHLAWLGHPSQEEVLPASAACVPGQLAGALSGMWPTGSSSTTSTSLPSVLLPTSSSSLAAMQSPAAFVSLSSAPPRSLCAIPTTAGGARSCTPKRPPAQGLVDSEACACTGVDKAAG
eukprot:CAMPEP_0179465472 /NCGR_PEP_ID=MMETSP0799-20121207/47028_1 /TAXON_ID=46947 /ORGANISM="Geminigera cryophila, Strain CCMP2564" /LENGTH=131 /DNA_ID=CAMNT_0021269769 /DNA_START=171 /DNA_END=566 /DNA_ORIENTATION=-